MVTMGKMVEKKKKKDGYVANGYLVDKRLPGLNDVRQTPTSDSQNSSGTKRKKSKRKTSDGDK